MAGTSTRAPRVPREHAVDPAAFGSTESIEWAYPQSGKTDAYARLIAAQTQHHYVVAIKRGLAAHGLNRRSYAERCSLPYDRLTKVMRGAVAMSLTDIACAELVLGEIITPALFNALRATIRQTRQRLADTDSPHG